MTLRWNPIRSALHPKAKFAIDIEKIAITPTAKVPINARPTGCIL